MPPESPPPNRTRLLGLCTAVIAATLLAMLATEPGLAIVWDEGYTLGRQDRLRAWFSALADPAGFAARWEPPAIELVQQDGQPPPARSQVDTRAELLSDPAVLAWFWPFAREEPHGHPPFYALVGLAGDLIAPGWEQLPRARLGPMLVFALTAGGLCGFAGARWGTAAGLVAAAAWVLQPNLFGHGHYATYDALLSALWLACLMTFALAVEPSGRRWPRWGWAVAFGVLAGCAADTKFTAWLLPVPMLAWVAAYRDRRGLVTLLVGGLVGLAVLYALNPPWWADPVGGVERFLRSNLTRGRTIPIPVQFLGRIYNTPVQSLPWYNTLAWTALVTPVGFLALALAGLTRALGRLRTERVGVLVATHWAFLLALRALPNTPGHDGVRQFLPAFGLLALLAGLGAAWLVGRSRIVGPALASAAVLEGVLAVALTLPVPLSYFSPAVGGLPGAARLGMEPTYYWDALTADALAWLNANTPPGRKVRFATFPTSWLYLRSTGRLGPEVLPNAPGDWSWYVVQNRPGALNPIDRALIRSGRPAHTVARRGVPLVWIFPYDQVETLLRSAPR